MIVLPARHHFGGMDSFKRLLFRHRLIVTTLFDEEQVICYQNSTKDHRQTPVIEIRYGVYLFIFSPRRL